jgi:hypothetical protein
MFDTYFVLGILEYKFLFQYLLYIFNLTTFYSCTKKQGLDITCIIIDLYCLIFMNIFSFSYFKKSFEYLTLRLVLSLNNPQNNEVKICEKYEVDMLKIIIIIIGYTLNNFIIHITILKLMMEKYITSKSKKRIQFLKINSYSFCRCGN